MAGALELMGQGVMYRTNHTPAAAIGMLLADSVVEFGGGIALGEVYTRYSELPGWKGKLAKYSPEIAGGVGKMLEGALTLWLGPGILSGLAGAVGSVGLAASGLTVGIDHAQKSMGIACVKVAAGTDVKKLKKGDAVSGTHVGALPQAQAGHGLAWSHIQDLQNSH